VVSVSLFVHQLAWLFDPLCFLQFICMSKRIEEGQVHCKYSILPGVINLDFKIIIVKCFHPHQFQCTYLHFLRRNLCILHRRKETVKTMRTSLFHFFLNHVLVSGKDYF
jgi:hypothetical protein